VALQQAAKNYNQSLFTALVWPEHSRAYNMGKVDSLRAAANVEGGTDLLARIAPNDYYLNANNAGQKLFTSMELIPNFRDTKEWYLSGLAATDSPASAATSEMRFSALHSQDAYLGTYTAHVNATQNLTTGKDNMKNKQASDIVTRLELNLNELGRSRDHNGHFANDAVMKSSHACISEGLSIREFGQQYGFTDQAYLKLRDMATKFRNLVDANKDLSVYL
jgi:hypothetical protein